MIIVCRKDSLTIIAFDPYFCFHQLIFYEKLVLSKNLGFENPGCRTRMLFGLNFQGCSTDFFLGVSTRCWWEGVTETVSREYNYEEEKNVILRHFGENGKNGMKSSGVSENPWKKDCSDLWMFYNTAKGLWHFFLVNLLQIILSVKEESNSLNF